MDVMATSSVFVRDWFLSRQLVEDLEAIDSNRFNRNATHIGIILIREEYFHALGAHYDSLLWERLGLDSLMWEMPHW